MMLSHCQNKVVAVTLTKLLNPRRTPEADSSRKSGIISFDAFGYYDIIEFSVCTNGASSIAKEATLSNVGKEKSILIPASDKEIGYSNHMAGYITFIIVNETNNQDLFQIGRNLESYMDEADIQAKVYVTMGASAIAIVGFCDNIHETKKNTNDYLNHLKNHVSNNNLFLYTFTVVFINPDRFDNSEEFIDSVYISFAWRANCSKNPNEYLGAIAKKLDCSTYQIGLLSGTDDYYLYAKDVSIKHLVSLYKSNDVFATHANECKEWYGDYCDSTFTTLGFASNPAETKTENDCAKSTDDGKSDAIERIKSVMKTVDETPGARGLKNYFSSFLALEETKYTKWVFQSYVGVVEFCSNLLSESIESTILQQEYAISDATMFFQLLSNMLESLLNTSAYLTDSPGYQAIESNCIPRLLLYYQKLLNKLVFLWDSKQHKGSKRKHLFFLSAQDGLDIKATMLFGNLPPDQRLISVSVPIYQACQPGILLPLLLHEAGHYVGVRHRKQEDNQSRDKCYIRLVVDRFCVSLCACMFGRKTHEIFELFRGKTVTFEAKDIIHTLFALYESEKELYNAVYDAYQKLRDDRVEQLTGKGQTLITERRIHALNTNYFSEMSIIVRVIFQSLLQEEPYFISNIIDAHFRERIAFAPTQELELREAKQRILALLKPALLQLASELYSTRTTDFVQESEDMLSEVAADIFMVKMCNMSSENYLALVFEQYAYEKSVVNQIVKQFSATPAAYIRILVVWSMLDRDNSANQKNTVSHFERERIKSIADYLGTCVDSVYEEYTRLKQWIENTHSEFTESPQSEWARNLRNMLLPYAHIYAYAQSLFNDTRYSKESSGDLQSYINKISDLYTSACNEIEGKGNASDVYRQLYTC